MTAEAKKKYPEWYISIHTPTKGVTAEAKKKYPEWYISIHTPTKGVTPVKGVQVWANQFQSTLPRREWHYADQWFERCWFDFNPHSHEGSDKAGIGQALDYVTFQSTLPRREWRGLHCEPDTVKDISIHTPTKGVTRHFPLITQEP